MKLERLTIDDSTYIEFYPAPEPIEPPKEDETPAPPTAEEATLEALAEQGESIEELKNHILTLMEAMAEKEEHA